MQTAIQRLSLLLFGAFTFVLPAAQINAAEPFIARIPRVWDDDAMAKLEIRLATDVKVQHIPSAYYYQIPVRTIYKTYPIYHPDREPPGYFAELLQKDPEIAFDSSRLKTKEDWIRAGQQVFESGLTPLSTDVPFTQVRNRAWYTETDAPLTKDGIMPLYRYVIRKRGQVEVTMDSCATCHTRVLPDGTAIQGAQGSVAFGKLFAFHIRHSPDAYRYKPARPQLLDLFGTPWIQPDPQAALMNMQMNDIADIVDRLPHGVVPRDGTSLAYSVQIPDLLGVHDRKYLDHTGLQHNGGLADLMRYDAINNFINDLTAFGDFRPFNALKSVAPADALPPASSQSRYSDEQLYALALFLESLRAPENPNKANALSRYGERVFAAQKCGICHTPPLFTNNKLTPVSGYDWQLRNRDLQQDIIPISVGTDSTNALLTRRGTGFYKVPSLRGVWYRSPLEHNGSIASLEEWFNPARLRSDYGSNNAKPYGMKTNAVAGHQFGLQLSVRDKAALIAYLRTL